MNLFAAFILITGMFFRIVESDMRSELEEAYIITSYWVCGDGSESNTDQYDTGCTLMLNYKLRDWVLDSWFGWHEKEPDFHVLSYADILATTKTNLTDGKSLHEVCLVPSDDLVELLNNRGLESWLFERRL